MTLCLKNSNIKQILNAASNTILIFCLLGMTPHGYICGGQKFTNRWITLMLSLDHLATLKFPISSQVFMYIQNIEIHSKQCCQLSTFVWFESHHAGVHRVEVMCWSSSDLAAMDCEEGPGNFRQVLPRRSRFSASASQSLLACNRNTLQKRLQHEGVNLIRRYVAGS